MHVAEKKEVGRSITLAVCAAVAVFGLSCGPSEEEILITELTEDLNSATTIIDSLNYTVESSNMLIDEMKSRVDSLHRVTPKLLESVQRLNKEVKKWANLASEHKRKNQQLTVEIENLKRDKQTDKRSIAKLRQQADSLNTTLLDAHTSIRRQEDQIRRMEVDLARSQDDAAVLKQAQTSVRVYAASESFLNENGYIKSSRAFRRGFRKSFKLIKKLDPTDPAVQLVAFGDTLNLEGKINTIVDRYGSLKKDSDYAATENNGMSSLTFANEMLGGVDVVAVMKK